MHPRYRRSTIQVNVGKCGLLDSYRSYNSQLELYVAETILSGLLPILSNSSIGFGSDGLLNEGEQTCWHCARQPVELGWHTTILLGYSTDRGGTHHTYWSYSILYCSLHVLHLANRNLAHKQKSYERSYSLHAQIGYVIHANVKTTHVSHLHVNHDKRTHTQHGTHILRRETPRNNRSWEVV